LTIFARRRFRRQAEAILLREFDCDPSKSPPAVQDVWMMLRRSCYATGGQPVSAPTIRMVFSGDLDG
jgi:hypothetical protein